ncbi:hypothetical protein AAG906_001395 [Vitis piasezkii]
MGAGCPVRRRSRRGCLMHINISLLKTEARCLEIPFSEEEVFSALPTLNRDKPQGEGFILGFKAGGRGGDEVEINLEKNELIPIGRVLNVEELVDILGHRVGSQPSKYLTLPLGVVFKSSKKVCIVEETILIKREGG